MITIKDGSLNLIKVWICADRYLNATYNGRTYHALATYNGRTYHSLATKNQNTDIRRALERLELPVGDYHCVIVKSFLEPPEIEYLHIRIEPDCTEHAERFDGMS